MFRRRLHNELPNASPPSIERSLQTPCGLRVSRAHESMITPLPAMRLRVADVPLVALALALPILLLRPDHVPVLVSRRHVELRPSDLAIAAVVVLAAAFVRDARSRLAARRWLWLVPFLVLLLASAATVPGAGQVTVAVLKLVEYAAFGIAVTLLLRSQRDMRIFVASLATSTAALGLLGAVQLLGEYRPGARAESLTGTDPLGLLGAATLVIALSAPGLLGSRKARYATAGAGLLCFAVASSLSAAAGLFLAVAFLAARRVGPFRRLSVASLAALAVAVLGLGGGLVASRWSDFSAAVDQITGLPAQPRPGGSFAQRAMFADFGFRIWLDHPLLGVGFQQTPRLDEWAPYLASVRADFPGLPPTYFPAISGISFGEPMSETNFGLHNLYSQLLAETGLVGLLLFATGFAGLAGPAFRGAARSEVPLTGALLVLVVLGGFTRNELYGGLPETTVLVVALAFAARGGESLDMNSRRRPSLPTVFGQPFSVNWPASKGDALRSKLGPDHGDE
jgi:O-antigen ligase